MIEPLRALGESVTVLCVMPFTSRSASKSPKIKVLPFLMGPPAEPPNWLRRNAGLPPSLQLGSVVGQESKKLRASRALFRRNS